MRYQISGRKLLIAKKNAWEPEITYHYDWQHFYDGTTDVDETFGMFDRQSVESSDDSTSDLLDIEIETTLEHTDSYSE